MPGTRRRPLLLASLLLIALASCGFTPVYAPGTKSAAALSDIKIAEPSNEQGYLFTREMEDRLGRAANPSKLLNYKITIRGEGVESDTDRRRFVGAVTYELIDINTRAVLEKGAVDSFAGYAVSDGLFSSARQDAIKRLVIILADQLTRELIVKLAAP